jgi:hypothetical protein
MVDYRAVLEESDVAIVKDDEDWSYNISHVFLTHLDVLVLTHVITV